jgi:Iron-containing redox enzyme
VNQDGHNGQPSEQRSYVGLRDRDYFHIMLNLDSYQDFLPTAWSLANHFLDEARKMQADPHLETELRPFRYTKGNFEARLDQIYQGLVDDVNRYETERGWALRTRDDVVEWIRQMAPFNQTDGAWLRNIVPVGPVDEVHSLLVNILMDEVGCGDPELNHANIYTELLHSVDINLPGIRTREYAENPDLLDSAFTLPLFQLVVSEFSQAFFPEILGMNQYLEWSSVELKTMALLNEHFGLDPHFYEMHVAIDNAAAGHGAMARRAIELYLEQTRAELGEDAMQAQWERIWNGYVAFATTGTLADDMLKRRLHPPTAADAITAMVQERAPRARVNHGQKRLAGTLINDLFADPAKLMAALVDGGMIVPGDDDNSPFFSLLTPDGPMYKVFSDKEIETWKKWVRSLPGVPVGEAASLPATPAERMAHLIDTMRVRQEGQPAHQATTLTGPDPSDSSKLVSKPVAWWFQQPTKAFMRALAHENSEWIIPGDAQGSQFVTDLLDGKNAMARAFSGVAPGTDGVTWATIAVDWISNGCPMPGGGTGDTRPLTLLSPPDRVAAHPTGKVHGTGSVH